MSMKAPPRVLLGVLLLTLGTSVMALAADKPVIKASSAVVTLDVFSGRPNPTWSLSQPATAELLRRLGALETSKVDAREFDDLGYRSVKAELAGEAKDTVVTASRGVVTLDRAGERFQYTDAGRQFELWLVNTGASHLTADLLRYVTGEIASKPK